MFTTYKGYYIEHDKDLSNPGWCICDLHDYICFLKNLSDENDWEFFKTLEDCKAFIDIQISNHN